MIRKIIIVVLTLAAALVALVPVALRYRAIETSVAEAYAVKSMDYSVLGVWWKVDRTASKGR
ncbi:MAG: hypothetical protein IID42_01250, partial [Planctomycetes bacterium]|nr:hypothetical protein [Planctomycetota bacterium]